jgi:hypothetical protein
VGFAPLTVDIAAGIREVVVSAAGFEPQRRTLEVKPGSAAELKMDLSLAPGPRFARVPWRGIGWVSTAFGVVLVGSGVLLLATRQNCDTSTDLPGCQQQLRTISGLAGSLLGAGGFALGFGALSFYAASVRDDSMPRGGGPRAALPGFMVMSSGTF